ncbi:MAG: hypothetical protein QNJ85_04230 [Gammaproteobacteria bacterium]|nr:hypothetical protein [Gammaproteobacteria bacterium]
MRNQAEHFFARGWCRFPFDRQILAWRDAAVDAARATLADPRHAAWYRYDNTWFAGVNVLPNRGDSAVGEGRPLAGEVIEFISHTLGLSDFAWDPAQVSVCFPGYPRPMAGESEARARYRRERDAAHVDGLLPEGERRRRHLREYHGFILGIPLVEFDPGAAPFVVYEGSHEIMRASFRRSFAGLAPADWGEVDVTDAYQAARERAFAESPRVEVHARPGETFLVHRLLLHGTGPWQEQAGAGPDGRMICFFRPPILAPGDWLERP